MNKPQSYEYAGITKSPGYLFDSYVQDGDADSTASLLQELFETLAGLNAPVIVLGDFQFQSHEAPIAQLLSGCSLSMISRLFLRPLLGLGGVRRIDYGLVSFDLSFASVCTVPGIADHSGVFYSFHGACVPPGANKPSRIQLCSDAELLSKQPERESDFASLFGSAGSINEKWQVLSEYAEGFLSGWELPNPSVVARRQVWQPCYRMPQRHKAAVGAEPLALRRLRRLRRRLAHFIRDRVRLFPL